MYSQIHMLCIMIVAALLSSLGYCSAASDVSSTLADVLNKHEHNFKSISTFHAEVKVMREKIYDVGAIKYWNKESLWFDRGSLCRKITDGGYSGDSPEGLVLKGDDKGGQYRATRTPVDSISIFTKEAEAWYDGSKAAVVNHPESMSIARDSNYLLRYQCALGEPLKEVVLKCKEEGTVTVQSESMDGEECVHLQWELPTRVGGSVWLVPSKGYCIKKLQLLFKGDIYNEYSTTLREYKPGFWWFQDVAVTENWGHGKVVTKEQIQVESVEFNQAIDPAVFTLRSLPPGTLINDRIAGIKYRVSDGRYALLDSAFESLHASMDVDDALSENDRAEGANKAETAVRGVNTADGGVGTGGSEEDSQENTLRRQAVVILGLIAVVLIMATGIGWWRKHNDERIKRGVL